MPSNAKFTSIAFSCILAIGLRGSSGSSDAADTCDAGACDGDDPASDDVIRADDLDDGVGDIGALLAKAEGLSNAARTAKTIDGSEALVLQAADAYAEALKQAGEILADKQANAWTVSIMSKLR
jgi:hypothetical protein